MGDEWVVRLETVSKAFGRVRAVDAVSLQVGRGEFVSLLGPSGCGKTTTLRLIAGFEFPDSGRVLISGRDMAEVPAFRRPVNTVFQSYALFPHLTVFDNVAFGLRRRGVAKDEIHRRVPEFLNLVRLSEFGARYPSQLSGGQQQRVALARALVNRPDVLLLDEPLGALDLKLRKQMQVELKHLQRELGISFIYVTHDQEEALALSDRIAVMEAGQVLQFERGRSIYEGPRSRFVADFIGEANILEGIVETPGQPLAVIVANQRIRAQSLHADALQPGAPITLAIRPERISVSLQPPTSPNVLKGRIVEKIYLGGSFLIYLDVGARDPLVARCGHRGLFDQLEPGAGVYAAWELEDGIVLSQ